MTQEPVQSAAIRDVTVRDGLQLTGKSLTTERKVEVIRSLFALGVTEIEIGSMARPDLIPQLADSLEVAAALTPAELASSWMWVATPRHVRKAAAVGVVNFQYVVSVSGSHNQANVARTTDVSMDGLPEAIEVAKSVGGVMQLGLATAFTCPFEGVIDPDRVLEIVNDPRTEGLDEVVLCDTLGQARPSEVSSLVRKVRELSPVRRIGYHGHDTWGMGVANTLAAVAAGATMVDSALGGLGGCPFAPGASGNAATEDVSYALEPEWLDPASFATMVRLSQRLLAELGEPNRSRAVDGSRSTACAFPWVLADSQR